MSGPDQRGAWVRCAALALVNLALLQVLVLRHPDDLARRLSGIAGPVVTLMLVVFPLPDTTALCVGVALAAAFLGRRLRLGRLVAAYTVSAAWCAAGLQLLQERWGGNPNHKLMILVIGVLVTWVGVTVWGRQPTAFRSVSLRGEALVATCVVAVFVTVSVLPVMVYGPAVLGAGAAVAVRRATETGACFRRVRHVRGRLSSPSAAARRQSSVAGGQRGG